MAATAKSKGVIMDLFPHGWSRVSAIDITLLELAARRLMAARSVEGNG
jgi:hypothetical protein